jgi:cardiolipin synthase
MMHGKLLVVDDVVYVGSATLDVRSRLINYELMLRLPVPALAEQARAMFDADLQHSRPSQMPTPSWWRRLRQRTAYWLLKRVDPYVARRKLRMLQWWSVARSSDPHSRGNCGRSLHEGGRS